MSDRPQLHGSYGFFATGAIGEPSFDVSSQYALNILIEDVGISSLVTIQARLFDQANWNTIGTISGLDSLQVNVSTYDQVRFMCSTYDAILVPTLIFSAFYLTPVEGSEIQFAVPLGDTSFNVSIQDPINFTSSDSSVLITGDAITGSLDFTVSSISGVVTLVEPYTLNALDESNKYLLLPTAPSIKEDTTLDIIGGSTQYYSEDYVVTNDDAGKRLSWSGLALDGVLSAGDRVLITYK